MQLADADATDSDGVQASGQEAAAGPEIKIKAHAEPLGTLSYASAEVGLRPVADSIHLKQGDREGLERSSESGSQITDDTEYYTAQSSGSGRIVTMADLRKQYPAPQSSYADLLVLKPLNPIAQAASDLLEEIIHNELPIYLIYLPTRKLMGRAAIWQMVLQSVLAIAKEDQPWKRQEGHMRRCIRKAVCFAILSHRWLPQGEVTFEDVARVGIGFGGRPAEYYVGLYKFVQFCNKGVEFGCKWGWADTCCINKKSSAELDESIRAMYRWYRNAEVCIVHLRDTHTFDDLANDGWFKRGWTLQELLAPKRIKFYDAGWRPLQGGKTTIDIDKTALPPPPAKSPAFLTMISKITGIPEYYLTTFNEGTYMIREKMIWASQRRTTRLEDMAYSLIGLFDVDMQIAYGEGERAFYRLQRAIMQQSPKEDIFMWQGRRYRPDSMFAKSPECFAPLDLECHLTATLLDHLRKIGRFRSVYEVENMVRALCPRGGRQFGMTNAGLCMEVVLYDLKPVVNRDGTVETEAVEVPDEADGRPSDGRWRVQVESLGSFEVQMPAPALPIHSKDYWRRMKLGVMDYERADAYGGDPYAFEEEWYNTWNLWHDLFPEDKEQFTKDIIKGRKERWYTAMLLYRHVQGPERPYERVETMDIIKVHRPPGGWKKPETIYFR